MPTTHLVVDGSNIATEGRSLPSLQQLMDAVDAISKEFEHANVTVIVDATFGHRIEAAERPAYEEKINTGELITPPAGVIGRGDAFILEVADRAGAIVLSNDSFQEFHGTYEWLFQEGRLLGGKHVPGVGWIFLARSPVRGPTSRRAVSDAKRKRRGSKQAASSKPESKRPSKDKAAKTSKASKAKAKAKPAKARAKAEADEPAGRKRGGKEPEPYNEPLPFIEFVGAHPVGSVIDAEVEQFASHGAYVLCDGTRCYISLKSISDPPPRSAREVLTIGETHQFVVKAIDTPRRGIDLVMPGMEGVEEESKAPAAVETAEPSEATETEEPVLAESAPADEQAEAVVAAAVDGGERRLSVSQRRKLRAQQAAAAAEEAERPQEATVKKSTAKKTATKKKAAVKKAATKKKAPAKKAATKKVAAKKATAKKATAKKSPAKKASTKKATAKKATAKKATAKKSPAKKASTKKATAKRATAKKAATKKAAPKKATAKRAATKRA